MSPPAEQTLASAQFLLPLPSSTSQVARAGLPVGAAESAAGAAEAAAGGAAEAAEAAEAAAGAAEAAAGAAAVAADSQVEGSLFILTFQPPG